MIYAFVTSGPPRTVSRDKSPDARQILDQRLAKRRSQGRGAPSITGKLTAVTNRIVDRGGLPVPR